MKVIQRLQRLLRTNRELWVCALLGAFTFIYIYGIHVLNPSYTDWLLTSVDGDLTQHYLGWKFYRHAGWTFPFGMTDTLAYPNRTSVIFTDSIPLFAFGFKLLRFLLPVRFQYFGWFGLLCFMLQGALGAGLVKKYAGNGFVTVAGGMFFVLSPVFIDRMYWMTALAAHFLCLLGLWFLVYYEETYWKTKRAVIGWGLLGMLCAGIHLYFLPMCGVILLGFLLLDWVKSGKYGKRRWEVFLPLLSYLGCALVTVFLFGGFGSGMKAGNDGLGYYSFNLNGFFNPQGWSAYLKDMPCTDSQYEGFGYLGLGCLVLFVCSAAVWLGTAGGKAENRSGGNCSADRGESGGSNRSGGRGESGGNRSGGRGENGGNRSGGDGEDGRRRGSMAAGWMGKHVYGVIFVGIFLLTLCMAVSNVVMYHDKVLCEIPLPGAVRRLWSVFRATGRLVWPAVYLLVLGVVCMGRKALNGRTGGILLAVCLLLQFADVKDMLAEKREVYNKRDSYQTLLPSETWRDIGEEKKIRHICFVSDMVSNRKLLFSFGDYASDYGLTLNDFYFARSLGDKGQRAKEQALAECPPDTLFVFFGNEAQQALAYPLYYYRVDGLVAGCAEPLDGLTPLTQEELLTYRYDMASGRFLNNAEVAEEGWLIHSYGNSYGPYLNAGAGRYLVTVQGSGLTAMDIKCYYNHGDVNLEPQNLAVADDGITFEVELTEYAPDLEIALWNVGGGDLLVTDLVIAKQ